jgi:hypothetical protein
VTGHRPPDPRTAAQQAESLEPDHSEEREQVRGYGVIGVPFASGDVLAMRRFPASSIGPGYTSVWHRAPTGRWTFYQDQDPMEACPRAFGPALDEAVRTDIRLAWTAPEAFEMEVARPVDLRWHVRLDATLVTRVLSGVVSLTPTPVRRSRAFAGVAARVAGAALHAGRLRLAGTVPTGQAFHADMRRVLVIDESHATVDGRDLGPPAPLTGEQEHLGDFWIPQRGLFAFGDGLFEPYDPRRHRLGATRDEVATNR